MACSELTCTPSAGARSGPLRVWKASSSQAACCRFSTSQASHAPQELTVRRGLQDGCIAALCASLGAMPGCCALSAPGMDGVRNEVNFTWIDVMNC